MGEKSNMPTNVGKKTPCCYALSAFLRLGWSTNAAGKGIRNSRLFPMQITETCADDVGGTTRKDPWIGDMLAQNKAVAGRMDC